jgi:hypothetical protein
MASGSLVGNVGIVGNPLLCGEKESSIDLWAMWA